MKSLVKAQQQLEPQAGTWLLASLSIIFRFGFAAILLFVWNFSSIKKMTTLEFYEGAGLGIIGGVGLLFQMDGVNYTAASVSAFITQSYCIFIPLLVACRKREWPSKTIAASTAMVLVGVALLSQFDWKEMRLGRGEVETLIASLFFTGQILWLERPLFSKNRPMNFSIVMFAVTALIFLPIPAMRENLTKLPGLYSTFLPIFFSIWLMVLSTLIAYTLMNYWQPHVAATQAGLIYSTEPVFTSVFALFLPAWFSSIAKIDYPNELLTVPQVIGGSLILGANALILWQAARNKQPKPEAVLA
jgi:drug/metabolite transporter (DMT)-like permease